MSVDQIRPTVPPPDGAMEPPPGWVWPAVGLGLVLPPLTVAARGDVTLLRRIPPSRYVPENIKKNKMLVASGNC